MKSWTVLACSTVLSACAGLDDIYINDPALATAAAAAESQFAAASSEELWQTMTRNVEATAAVEKAMFDTAAAQRFEGQLQFVEVVTWQDLADCGQGLCWTASSAEDFGVELSSINVGLLRDQPTEQKITVLVERVAKLTTDITALRKKISEHVPVNETIDLAMTSDIAQAIKDFESEVESMDRELERFKDEKLSQIEAEIGNIIQPILNPFPSARQEILDAINAAIPDIRDELADISGIQGLPGETLTLILGELDAALPSELPDSARAALLDQLNELFGLDGVNERLSKRLDDLVKIVADLDTDLGKIEELSIRAFGADQNLSTRLHALTDILRKSEHLDLVKLESVESMLGEDGLRQLQGIADKVSISDLFDSLKGNELSSEFATAFEESAGRKLCDVTTCTVGDVLEYLKTDESKLEAVRISLRDDFRRATITAYNYELKTLQRELAGMKKLVSVVRRQHETQRNFGARVARHINDHKINNLDISIYHQLDCLARSAGSTHGSSCAADTREARDQFSNTLLVLAIYYSMEGDLREQEIGLWRDLVRMKHLRSIEASKLAAMAHEQFILHGLQGLVAFTEGGITTDQMASVLRFVNTGLLTVIAGEQ